jgi:hypothetical protein
MLGFQALKGCRISGLNLLDCAFRGRSQRLEISSMGIASFILSQGISQTSS